MELWVAGRGLRPDEQAMLASTDGIELKGYVEDLDGFYASVDLVVAPLLDGEGAPTKVMEALGYGVPVVGTPTGLRGVPADLATYCISADGAAAWTDAIRRALVAKQSLKRDKRLLTYTWTSLLDHYAAPYLPS
jgi:glycosyltransferase involved in cell wall biosynthesis